MRRRNDAAGEQAGLHPRLERNGGKRFLMVVRWWPQAAHLIVRFQGPIAAGHNLVFHCRAGIGRSGMIAASILLQEGLSAREAFARISAARGLTIPDTPGQLEWVEEHRETIIRRT